MRKRLTQPFLGWQLAFAIVVLAIPATAAAQRLDSMTRAQALEPSDFPHDVVLVGDLPPTISEAQWEHAVKQATRSWNSVACSSAELKYAGRVDTAVDAPARATTVAFVDPDEEVCFGIPTDVGWTLQTECGDWHRTAVLLNTRGVKWSADPEPYQNPGDSVVDVPSVLTHELGHSLGLHHEDVSDPLASMTPHYLLDGGLASLSAQDKLALCALYPVEARECVPPARCEGGGECVSDGARIAVCNEPRASTGDYCDLAELNCDRGPGGAPGTCYLSSPDTFSGYCSTACLDAEDCPDDMFCDPAPHECRFGAVPIDASGCSTGNAKTSTWPLLALFVGILVTRRRRR